MTTHFRSARALLLLATLLAVACAGRAGVGLSPIAVPETSEPVEARVDIDSAIMIAESALAGLEEGDYDTFTAAWSDAMRAGVGEDVFQDVRQATLEAGGRFVSIADVRVARGPREGTIVYYFVCDFERDRLVYAIAFATDGDEVIGAWIGYAE